MLEELKKLVYDANMLLPKYGLVAFTWGNVSAIDREKGLVVIKPSGVEYDVLRVEDMVVVDMNGIVVDGSLRPSSDTATHIELYRNFKNIGGVVHTHSKWATIFAQAGKCISAFGTTHADYFEGEILVTEKMTAEQIKGDYEKQTGVVIVQRLADHDPDRNPAILVHSHGPFVWGGNAIEAVHNAMVLEIVAEMAYGTQMLGRPADYPMQQDLLDKHFNRKHGPGAYYGQK